MLSSRAVRIALAALMSAALGATAAHAVQVRVVPQSINEFVFNPTDGFLYASVPSSAQAYGNSLVRIDVVTGAIVASVAVGSEPRDLALSDDGRTLYVGLDGAAAIRRVDVSTMTAGAQFSLGTDAYTGPYFAEDIEVMPGNPNVVAVSLRNAGFSPRHEGVAIFDNGVARPTRTPDHTGSNVIEFGASATRVYGYNNETTEFGFRRMNVSSSGITVIESTPNLIGGFGADIRYFGGRIYATTGQVIDPESRTLLGTFSFDQYSFGRAVVPGADRVYIATGDFGYGSAAQMNIFDPATFSAIRRYSIPGVSGMPLGMVGTGAARLALRTDADARFYLLDDVETPPAADLALSMSDSPDPATVDNYLAYSMVIWNHGEAIAEQSTLRFVRPASADYQWATPSRGYCYDSLGVVVCQFGQVSGGESLTVQVNVVPRAEGTIEARASVSTTTFDNDPSNNEASATTTVRPAGWDSADLFVRFTSLPDSQTIAGKEVVFGLEVGNLGPAVATGMRFAVSIYGDSIAVAVDGSDHCMEFVSGQICSLGTVGVGESRPIKVRFAPGRPGFLGVNLNIFGDQNDPNYANNAQFAWLQVLPSAERQLEALMASVESLDMKGGTANGLKRPLQDALGALQAKDTTGCCAALDQFQERVDIRVGRLLTIANAFTLQLECAGIQGILNCGIESRTFARDRKQVRLAAGSAADGVPVESEDGSATELPRRLGIAPAAGAPAAMMLVSMPTAGRAKVELLDVQGRVVRDVFDGELSAGVHRVWWGRPEGATGIPSGVYFYRVTANGQQSVAKAVMLN